MRTLRFFSIVFVMLLSTIVLAKNPDGATESAVKETITKYIGGIDSRNTGAVEQSLYSDATVLTVNAISNKTNKFSVSDVINKVKNGSLGGWKREINFSSVDSNDKTAIAKVELSDAKVKQTCFLTLINDNGTWKIVSDVSMVAQKK